MTDEATLEAALECLSEHLPLVPEDSSCTAEHLFEILLRAASRHDSIEHTAQRLQGVPSSNGIRYHLDKLEDVSCQLPCPMRVNYLDRLINAPIN